MNVANNAILNNWIAWSWLTIVMTRKNLATACNTLKRFHSDYILFDNNGSNNYEPSAKFNRQFITLSVNMERAASCYWLSAVCCPIDLTLRLTLFRINWKSSMLWNIHRCNGLYVLDMCLTHERQLQRKSLLIIHSNVK